MQRFRTVLKLSSTVGRICNNETQQLRNLSALNPAYSQESPVKIAYTSLKCPKDHTYDHIGMWYTLDAEMANRLFSSEGLPTVQRDLHKILNETSFMVREPAINVIDLVNRSNLQQPPNKFILYGRNGVGKTTSLAHVLHHFAQENWVIVHAGIPVRWATLFKEIVPSTTKPGYYDHTVDASSWLQKFRKQNGTLLENPELITSETYQWTQREATVIGSPILSLIDFGIARGRYASLCVFHLTNELKKLATQERIKMAVVVDGVNSLFAPISKFLIEDRTVVPCDKFTLFKAFTQLFNNDWKNGAIVGSVDVSMSTKEKRKSYLPRYLLGKEAWDLLDPFVPISVDCYTDLELESALNYYVGRKWLQHPSGRTKEGKQELAFMSGKNGRELIRIVTSR